MENERSGQVEAEQRRKEGQRRSLQQVWSWGAGTEGQLGTGKLEDEHLPRLLPHFNPSRPVSTLACGGAHVIALTSDGKVMSWGRGTSGQLGHGEMANSLHPKAVDFSEKITITLVSAGWSHSGFVSGRFLYCDGSVAGMVMCDFGSSLVLLTLPALLCLLEEDSSDTGRFFACGDGSFGQLGLGDYGSRGTPTNVSFFDRKHVVQIACGMRHSLVLLKGPSGNQVYSFGSGKRGQLGLNKEKLRSVSIPQLICGFEDADVFSVAANGDHSAALSADGRLYTWGRGFGGNCNGNSPRLLASSLRFHSVALGWNHALLLTGDGGLFMLGGSHHGALSSLDHASHAKEFLDPGEPVITRVSSPDEARVVQVAAGAEHSILVTENGEVKTWGWGEHGQLGRGDTEDQIEPLAVSLPDAVENEEAMLYVSCGSGFTYAIRSITVDDPDDNCVPEQVGPMSVYK